jgi:hypothetical protein
MSPSAFGSEVVAVGDVQRLVIGRIVREDEAIEGDQCDTVEHRPPLESSW